MNKYRNKYTEKRVRILHEFREKRVQISHEFRDTHWSPNSITKSLIEFKMNFSFFQNFNLSILIPLLLIFFFNT